MVTKKTFIITIVAMCILFMLILGLFYYYHISEINNIIEQKSTLNIIENKRPEGFENVVVE